MQDLDPLWTLSKLKYLSLLDNTVTKKAQYRCPLTRSPQATAAFAVPLQVLLVKLALCWNALTRGCRLYVISKCRRLKVLDFRKVKQKVRTGFGTCCAVTWSSGGDSKPQSGR